MDKHVLKFFFIKSDGKHIPIDPEDISYCEASGCYTMLHFISREAIFYSKTLKQVEELLGTESFIRVHRSFLINRNQVKEILNYKTPVIILKCGKEITTSYRKRSNLRKILFFLWCIF